MVDTCLAVRENGIRPERTVDPEGSRRVEWFTHLMNRNNRRCLLDGRKEMYKPGKIEDVKNTLRARARKVL